MPITLILFLDLRSPKFRLSLTLPINRHSPIIATSLDANRSPRNTRTSPKRSVIVSRSLSVYYSCVCAADALRLQRSRRHNPISRRRCESNRLRKKNSNNFRAIPLPFGCCRIALNIPLRNSNRKRLQLQVSRKSLASQSVVSPVDCESIASLPAGFEPAIVCTSRPSSPCAEPSI